MVDVAEVKIWGELAGAVRWDDEQQLGYFQYDTKFLEKGWDLSPIKMPIRNGSRIYSHFKFKMNGFFSTCPSADREVGRLPILVAHKTPFGSLAGAGSILLEIHATSVTLSVISLAFRITFLTICSLKRHC